MSAEVGALRVNLDLNSASFERGVKGVNLQIKALRSEMTAMMSGNREYANSLDGMKARSENLSRVYEAQKAKVNYLRQEYERLKAAHGENSREALRALDAHNRATGQMNRTESTLSNLNRRITDAENKWRSLGQRLTETGNKFKSVGQSMTSIGQSMAMKITAPIVGIGAAALKVGADFQEGMSKVAAVSGATGSDLDALTKQARELGKNTKFSATEAAEGMQYLALAGFKTKDIMSAMPGMLDLAAAGALDLGRAADITSDTMQAFGLSADKATHAADVFAYAQANANTNVEQMGEALKYSAPAAHSFGWSLEETSAATMVFANSGLKGSIAGQAFASSLTRLAHPTKKMGKLMKETGIEFFDAAGNMKSMPEVVKALEVATKDMTQEQRAAHLSVLFGAEAYKHWAILLENGSDKLRSMTEDLENADGAAAKMAKTMSDNLKGKLKTLQSSLQEVGIKISTYLMPVATKLTEKLTVMTKKFGELSPATQTTILALAGVAAVIPPLLIAGGALVSSLGAIMTGLGTVSGAVAVVAGGATAATPAVAALASTFTVLTGPVGLAIAGLAAVGFAAYKVSKEMKKPIIETEVFSEKVSESTKKAVGSYLKLDEQATIALNQLAWSHKKVTGKMADSMVAKYNQMGERILSSMREKQAKQIEQTQKFFLQSSALSEKEESTILESLNKKNEAEQKKVTEGQARIKEILTKAKNEKRALTEAESVEIAHIQDQMRVTAVQTLSKSELEQKAILSRLKSESSKISAEQAAEVVRNSKKQTDQTIQNASVQYEKTKANIEHLRDDLGVISAEQANKLIAEAERQRDETKKKAEEMHESVVKEAKAQAGEHVNQVDWTTGQIKSKWQTFKEDFLRKTKEISDGTIKLFADLYKSIPKGMEESKNKISNLWDELKSKTDKKLKDTIAIVRDSGSGIASAFKSWQTSIGSWFDSMPAILREKLKSWGSAFKDWIHQQNEENKRQYGIWWDSISAWFTSSAEKIPQKLEEWKVKFSNWFTENQSLIGQKLEGWGTGISDWFTTTRERIYTSLGGWGTRISGWFTEMKTLIPKKLEEWWKNTETWITGKYTSWTSALGSWTKAIGTWFSELPSKTATSINAWGTSIKNSVISLSTGWKTALDSWWKEIKNWFSGLGNKPEVKDSGKKLVNKISEGAGEQKKSFMDNIGKIIVDGLKNVAIIGAVIALSVGRELIKRMINGIEEMHGAFKKAWDYLLSLAAGKLKEMAKSVSNSWISISKNTSEMIGGIKKTVAGLWDDVVDGAKKLPGRIGSALSKMASGVNKGVKAVANKLAEGLEKGLNGAIKGINFVLGKVHAPLLDHPIKLERYAKGTKGHPGGLAIVGDRPGGGDGPAELIGTPDGKMYLSPAKETLVDLPKGSWVMPGKETKKFLSNIPAYHGGVGNYAKGAAKAVSSGFGKAKDFALDVWDYLHDIPGMMKKVWNNFIPDMGIKGAMADFAKGGLTKVKDGAVDWLKEKVASTFIGDGWTGGMEKDPGAVGPGSGFGGMMKYVEHWYNQVKNRFGPTRFMGAYNNRNVRGGKSKSMHAYGRAFDIGGSPSTMKAIAEFLRQSASNLQYVIYNRRIAGPGQGKPWRGYNGVNPHVDHVHADFKAVGGGNGIPGGKISGNLSGWINAAMAKAGVSGSNWLQGLAWIINKESSGRPGAVGAMTSTGTAKGLMQLKDFNYKGNPFDPVNNIFYGIKYILGRYKSIEGALSWWRKHNWYKNGTSFHPGGPAVVNDGNGPELIQFPTGAFGMFKGKNVLTDLPRGTKVLRHEKTKEVIKSGLLGNVPLYAKGVGDLAYIVKAGDTLSKIAKQFKTTVEELVKLNNIKDKNKIQVGQRIVYGKGSDQGLMTGQNSFNMGPVVPSKPPVDTRPQYAKDVTYLMGKAAKEEDAQLAQMKKELNNKLVELEKEKTAKIKVINEKAAKANKQLLEKEKEAAEKIKAINDKAAKSKRGLTAKEKQQIKKIQSDYEKAVNNNKDLTKKEKEQIKKINDDYAKKERAAVNAHNKQISEIEKAAQQKRMQEIDAYVARKKEAGKLSLYDEIQVYRESMRYYKKNSEEWFAAEQKLNQAKVQMHNELKALKDDYLAKVKEVNQRVIDEEKRLNEEYNRALEDRTKAITGFAGLFDKVEKPEEALDPKELIDNLHSQVYALNNWRTNLDALVSRGIDNALLEELQQMGPQALAQIKALNDMTDTQLTQFQSLWKDKTEAARLQATKELAGMKQETLKQIEILHRDAEKELDELNKTFTQKMTELRTGAINEFQPFGAQLKDIGINAVKGLMDGMSDMQGPLKNKMNEISKIMVDTMKKSLEIKSPSRKARREIAGDYGRGILVGLDDLKTPLVSKMKRVANWMGLSPDVPDLSFASRGGGGGNSYDYSSTVAPNIVLNYYGSGSEEDAMRMVDIVDQEFSWRTKNKMIARGMRG